MLAPLARPRQSGVVFVRADLSRPPPVSNQNLKPRVPLQVSGASFLAGCDARPALTFVGP